MDASPIVKPSERPPGVHCVFCLFVGLPPSDREPDEWDESRDGLAVTVVGGTAVCGWHVNAAMPADTAWLIKQFGEQMGRADGSVAAAVVVGGERAGARRRGGGMVAATGRGTVPGAVVGTAAAGRGPMTATDPTPPPEVYRALAEAQARRWAYSESPDAETLAEYLDQRVADENLRVDVDVVWRLAVRHLAEPAEFDRNPEAIAWARAKIQREVAKMADWERRATEDGKTDPILWRKIRNFLQREFLGTGNCVIAAFDERLPEYKAMLDRAVDA